MTTTLDVRPTHEKQLIRELISSIPVAGPFVNYFMAITGAADINTEIQKSLADSLAHLLERIHEQREEIVREISAGRLTAEEMYWTIRQVTEAFAGTPSDAKRQMLTEAAVNGFAQKDRDQARHRLLMRAMVQLDEGHVILLKALSALPKQGPELKDLVFNQLVPTLKTMGSATIVKAYWSELLSCNLVWLPPRIEYFSTSTELGDELEGIAGIRPTELGLSLIDLLEHSSD